MGGIVSLTSENFASKFISITLIPGVDIRLLKTLSSAMNFKLRIMNPSDGDKWGSPMANGSWSGLTGDIVQKKAHMGVANLFIHLHYLKVWKISLIAHE